MNDPKQIANDYLATWNAPADERAKHLMRRLRADAAVLPQNRRSRVSVTYVIEFHVLPPERDRFLALLHPVLDAMSHESTFEAASLATDPEDANRLLLHETWAEHQDVLDVQLSRPYRADCHAALDGLLARPRVIGTWSSIRTDHAVGVPWRQRHADLPA